MMCGTAFGSLLPFPPGDVAVITVVSDHLLPPVWDMRAHGRKPLRGVEDLPVFTAFCRIDDGSFISEILHPFLGKGCPDGQRAYLAASKWRLGFIMEEWPDVSFRKTREHN